MRITGTLLPKSSGMGSTETTVPETVAWTSDVIFPSPLAIF